MYVLTRKFSVVNLLGRLGRFSIVFSSVSINTLIPANQPRLYFITSPGSLASSVLPRYR